MNRLTNYFAQEISNLMNIIMGSDVSSFLSDVVDVVMTPFKEIVKVFTGVRPKQELMLLVMLVIKLALIC